VGGLLRKVGRHRRCRVCLAWFFLGRLRMFCFVSTALRFLLLLFGLLIFLVSCYLIMFYVFKILVAVAIVFYMVLEKFIYHYWYKCI